MRKSRFTVEQMLQILREARESYDDVGRVDPRAAGPRASALGRSQPRRTEATTTRKTGSQSSPLTARAL
jgi:hypothetical protein